MNLAERLLLQFSREPEAKDYTSGDQQALGDPLYALKAVFPEILKDLPGKDLLDFGCAGGRLTVPLAQLGANRVWGLDIIEKFLQDGRVRAEQNGVSDRVKFFTHLDESHNGTFDYVLSHNSMEHFSDPAAILNEMKRFLKPDGRILITFAPPWYAPYGSHMHNFTRLPWVNLMFSEKTVMAVRARFRDDGATRYEDVPGGLNRMTVGKFERLINQAGLKIEMKLLECVKGMNFLSSLPLLRELFTNRVSASLSRLNHSES